MRNDDEIWERQEEARSKEDDNSQSTEVTWGVLGSERGVSEPKKGVSFAPNIQDRMEEVKERKEESQIDKMAQELIKAMTCELLNLRNKETRLLIKERVGRNFKSRGEMAREVGRFEYDQLMERVEMLEERVDREMEVSGEIVKAAQEGVIDVRGLTESMEVLADTMTVQADR